MPIPEMRALLIDCLAVTPPDSKFPTYGLWRTALQSAIQNIDAGDPHPVEFLAAWSVRLDRHYTREVWSRKANRTAFRIVYRQCGGSPLPAAEEAQWIEEVRQYLRYVV